MMPSADLTSTDIVAVPLNVGDGHPLEVLLRRGGSAVRNRSPRCFETFLFFPLP